MTPVINNNGKVVGMIDGEVYKKILKKSKHFMKIFNGWGMDKEHLNLSFKEVRILDEESDQVYISTKEAWQEHGIRGNFRFGDQIFLPVKYFSIVSKNQRSLT